MGSVAGNCGGAFGAGDRRRPALAFNAWARRDTDASPKATTGPPVATSGANDTLWTAGRTLAVLPLDTGAAEGSFVQREPCLQTHTKDTF